MLAVNTGKTFLSCVPVSDDGPLTYGNFAIDGVPGKASKITLKFHDPGGSLGKGVLPTESLIDHIKTPLNGIFKASIIDVGIPTIFVSVEDFSYKTSCTVEDLDRDSETYSALRREAIETGYASLLHYTAICFYVKHMLNCMCKSPCCKISGRYYV